MSDPVEAGGTAVGGITVSAIEPTAVEASAVEVSGIELRYLLTTYLFDHGPASIDELVDALACQGFSVKGRASKVVSDALRWEIERGRVIRPRRGWYGPAWMPRATEYRMEQRVRSLQEQVRAHVDEQVRAHVAGVSLRGGHIADGPKPAA